MVRLQPESLDARLRVADSLLALGRVQPAAVVYTALVRHAAHAGRPLRAFVGLKILSALEPQLGALVTGLAELYAVGSPRLGKATRISPGDPEAALPESFELKDPPDEDALAEVAARLASDTSAIAAYPAHLPPIPLFSELPAEAFGAVLSAAKLVRARAGETLIAEGEEGRSFYMLARGAVAVTKAGPDGEQVTLATLRDGSIFGEMALVSALPRSATVTALTDSDLLELDREALRAAAREVETLARALDKFTRERLLANLLATAPLFRPLDRKQRLDLMRRFSARDLGAGTTIIEEGRPGQGLYVVLSGEVDVTKVDGHEKVLLATLKPGDVFGEISLLHEAATTATVTTASTATVLFLGREYFQKLVAAVPAIRTYVEGLGEERLMDTRILLSSGEDDSDEAVLL